MFLGILLDFREILYRKTEYGGSSMKGKTFYLRPIFSQYSWNQSF